MNEQEQSALYNQGIEDRKAAEIGFKKSKYGLDRKGEYLTFFKKETAPKNIVEFAPWYEGWIKQSGVIN